MLRFLLGTLGAVLALVGTYVLEGGDAVFLVSISAFLITFLMPFFGALAVWNLATWVRAWRHAFTKASAAEAQTSIELWKLSEFICYLAGLVGFLAGGVIILTNLNGDALHLGRAFSAGLLGPLYGLLAGFVCRLLRTRVETLNP